MFLDDNFLLDSEYARTIYNAIKDMPIIDYHCHLDAKDIYEDTKYQSISDVWLSADHYKWRAMRNLGVSENLITGSADSYAKFLAYARAIPKLVGHPLLHFSQLELKKYFGISALLSENNAQSIFEETNRILAKKSCRDIIAESNVKVIITTNDPTEDLVYHKYLKESGYPILVLPSFRPDAALAIEKGDFLRYMSKMEKVIGYKITSLSSLKNALAERLKYFLACGALTSDHGLNVLPFCKCKTEEVESIFKKALAREELSLQEIESYKTHMLLFLANQYKANNMVMELHFGVARNNSTVMYQKLGADAGYDTMIGDTGITKLVGLLNEMESTKSLPKTIVFSLNPNDNPIIVSVAGSFVQEGVKGYVQQGVSWWFNDTLNGIRSQIVNYMEGASLDSFLGMLTDSRSFLSYARHDYFRRILCNILGERIAKEEYPDYAIDTLIDIAKNVSCRNAIEFFGLKLDSSLHG